MFAFLKRSFWWACLLFALSAIAGSGAGIPATVDIDLPAGEAAGTIRQLTAQTGLQVIFRPDLVSGVITRTVRGSFSPRVALDRLLEGTPLAVVPDNVSGAFAVVRRDGGHNGRLTDPSNPSDKQPAARSNSNAAKADSEAPMHPRTPSLSRNPLTWLVGALAFVVAPDPLTAQSAVPIAGNPAPPEVDKAIELSPFEVRADAEIGYRASVSTSGSRLNTDYKDIASRLEVMTPEFLSDIGAFTVEEAFSYSGNTESPAEAWGVGAGSGAGFLGTASSSSVPSRTRGLSKTTPTRNFFKTLLPFDSYNSFDSGLTIASGPNPGLFGLGSPSGITNSTFNRAELTRKKGRVRLMTDSNGSQRADLDYNAPLLPGRLGFRLDGLYSDKKYPFKGNYAKDKRITGIIGWAPFKRLTIDVYGEYVGRKTSVPFYSLPTDGVTTWVNPGIGNRTPFTTFDTSPDPAALARTNTPGNNAYLNGWAAAAGDAPTYAFGANISPGLYSYRYTAIPVTLGRYLNQVLLLAPDIGQPSLQDERVYPFKQKALFAATRPSVLNARSVTAISNLKLTNNLFLEFAANYQTMLEKNATMYSPSDVTLYIDPNQYSYQAGYTPLDPITAGASQTSNRAANAARRVVNPNFGSLYLDGSQAAIVNESAFKEARLSLAYEFEAGRKLKFGERFGIFGRQRFLATGSANEATDLSQRFGRLVLDNVNPSTGQVSIPSVITAANAKAGVRGYMVAPNRTFRTRQYIDPKDPRYASGTLALDPFDTWTFQDANGQPYRVGLFEQGATGTATAGKTADYSAALVYQGYFLKDRLVLTYSRRHDRIETKSLNPFINVISTDTGLVPHYSTIPWDRFERFPTFINTSKSAVLHPLKWVSLHYNESSNNDPTPPTSQNIDGLPSAFSSGVNKEYGVQFSWRGIALVINQFHTALTSQDAGNAFGNSTLGRSVDTLESRYIQIQRARSQALGLPEFGDYYLKSATAPGYNPADGGRYRLYTDNDSKGTELELNGRLGKLDLRFSAGRTKAVKSNIGSGWQNYAVDPAIFARMEGLEWFAFDPIAGANRPVVSVNAAGQPVFGAPGSTPLKGWKNVRMADTTSTTSLFDQYSNNVLPGALLVQRLDGTSNALIREWRYNATLAYSLSRRWRGGLSVRSRTKALVGYMNEATTVTIAGNQVTTVAANLNKPNYSDAQWYLDPFVSFRGKLGKKQDYTIQLNVFNALNNNDLIVNLISASSANKVDVNDPRFTYYGWSNPQAIPAIFQVQDPRNIQLTVKLDF